MKAKLRNDLARLAVATAMGACWTSPTSAYERDVHYGLTYWLALKAGFSEPEAQAIATGDARVDSGGPLAIDANIDYSCAHPNPAAARRVQQSHYPSEQVVPSPAAKRVVFAGGDAAKREFASALESSKKQPAEMLSLFGRALHPYQDSWSHAGVAGLPNVSTKLNCDPLLSFGHPDRRGGPESHKGDLTFAYPIDVLSMAQATYEALAAYPVIDRRDRSMTPWAQLVGPLTKFSRARTKAEKLNWFAAEGVRDVGFLEGITLPDGAGMEPVQFTGSLLPKLNVSTSSQYDAPEEQRAFFDKLFSSWLVAGIPGASLGEFVGGTKRDSDQVIARMKLLKIRDHGLTAEMLHRKGRLNSRDLARIDSWSRATAAQIRPVSVADAFLALTAATDKASPLLPYILRPLQASRASAERVVAITRLKHLPYDTEGWIAEKTDNGWKLVEVIAVVDQ
jgi:hypothetical protein